MFRRSKVKTIESFYDWKKVWDSSPFVETRLGLLHGNPITREGSAVHWGKENRKFLSFFLDLVIDNTSAELSKKALFVIVDTMQSEFIFKGEYDFTGLAHLVGGVAQDDIINKKVKSVFSVPIFRVNNIRLNKVKAFLVSLFCIKMEKNGNLNQEDFWIMKMVIKFKVVDSIIYFMDKKHIVPSEDFLGQVEYFVFEKKPPFGRNAFSDKSCCYGISMFHTLKWFRKASLELFEKV